MEFKNSATIQWIGFWKPLHVKRLVHNPSWLLCLNGPSDFYVMPFIKCKFRRNSLFQDGGAVWDWEQNVTDWNPAALGWIPVLCECDLGQASCCAVPGVCSHASLKRLGTWHCAYYVYLPTFSLYNNIRTLFAERNNFQTIKLADSYYWCLEKLTLKLMLEKIRTSETHVELQVSVSSG